MAVPHATLETLLTSPLIFLDRCNESKDGLSYHHHYQHHNLGHQHNIIWFYNLFHQLTAKLKIGPYGPSAAQPAEVEPRREEEELFKRQRMEELSVQLWRKRSLATLTNAQVIFFPMNKSLAGSVDCEVEDWSSWSECSATCGGGTRTRERKVVQEPENGGAACQDREEEESCKTEPCEGILN